MTDRFRTSPVRTRYTVLHVRENWLDVEHAVSLLDPSYTGYDLAGKDGWTTISLTERDAGTLAPALAGTVHKPVYVVTVDGDDCVAAIAQPDQRVLTKDDAELADPALTGTDKHRRALRLLGVPESCADRPYPTAGVLVLCSSPDTVRDKLPDADHGVWLLPIEGRDDRCAVVSDGTGWEPDAEAIQAGLADHAELSMVVVTWRADTDDGPAFGYLEVMTRTDSYEVDLGPRETGSDAAGNDEAEDPAETEELDRLASTFGRLVGLSEAGRADVLAAIERSRTDLDGACATLLALAGVTGVPPGSTATELAEWASRQTGTVRLTDGTGVRPPALRSSVAEARHSYVRRNRLRAVSRAFAWVGVFAFLAGLAVLLWGPPVWTVAAFAVIVLVVAGRAGVKRLIRPRAPT